MRDFDQDDWLAQRIRALKPGWRGRLRVLAPEEAKSKVGEDFIGTIVDEPLFDDDENEADDATVTMCANYRAGHFVDSSGEPHFTVRISHITEIEAM
jgi:hypothetical protein